MAILRYFNEILKKQDRTALEHLSLAAIFVLHITEKNSDIHNYDTRSGLCTLHP